MSNKNLLKKVKEHLSQKEFGKAKDICTRILMFDANNYTGLVYLGLAQQNLGLPSESESTYKKAIALSPSQPVAYQGLISLYEKTDQVDMLPQAYNDARRIFIEAGAAPKVVELTNKLMEFYAQDPAYLELRLKTIRSLLPGGEMFSYVDKNEGTSLSLLMTLADLELARDQKQFVSEVESRRRRLSNDTMDTVRRKVRTEIHQQSQYRWALEMILENRADLDEGLWLKYNEAYLKYLLERLLCTLADDKLKVLHDMLAHSSKLVEEGVVLDLAYEIHYGFQDVDCFGYAMEVYLQTHPTSQLALLAKHILDKIRPPFALEDLDSSSICLVAHHALAWHYLRLGQLDLALSHAKSLDTFIKGFPVAFPRVRESCRLVFGFCYLKLEPSLQNVAYNTFQSILEADPHNMLALEGVSTYAISKGLLDLAKSTIGTALKLDPSHPDMLFSLGWICILDGAPADAIAPIQKALALNPDSALGLFRLGRAYWDMGGEFKKDKAYAYGYFLKAAQADSTSGDAFLFLGHFYRDVACDKTRALKCYVKATQLKQGIDSYRALYAQQLEVGDIKGAQNSIQLATQEFPTLAWAWGKLGLFHLSQSMWVEAISCFQSALKADFDRVEYWEGLGEAYLEAGRLLASLKAFQRAEKLDPSSHAITYHMAKVQLLLGKHQVASSGLEAVIRTLEPDSIYFPPCLKLLAEVFYCHSQVAHRSGAFGLMATLAEKSIHALERLLTHDATLYSGWELLGDVALLARLAPIQFRHLDLSRLLANEAINLPSDDMDTCQILLNVAALSYRNVVRGLPSSELAGQFLFKAAFAFQALHVYTKATDSLEEAISYICSALNHEPTNPLFWELLGTVTININPSISQHAFCQSILLDPRNPSPYSNYGYLCLLQGDFELSTISFSKAQSILPEFPPSWIGQAIVAQTTSAPNALEVVSHAFTLNESISKGLNLAYAACLLKDALPRTLASQQLHSGIFALQKFIELAPTHPQALNLLATYYEQAGSLEAAADALTVAKDSLVEEHMSNQDSSPTVLCQFVRVMLNLGRVQISLRKFNEAGAAYQAAEGCVDELHGPISERDAVHLQLGLGIARFYHNDLQPALESFERALELSSTFPALHHQVTLQVSQTLWAMGGKDHQDAAKEQLMGCVRNQTQTVGVLLALLVMGLIQGDTDLASAVLGELHNIPSHIQQHEDPEMAMPFVLSQLESLQKDYSTAIATLTGNLLKHPYLPDPYLLLTRHLLQLHQLHTPAAKMIRSIANSGLATTITHPNLIRSSTDPATLVSELHLAQAIATQLNSKNPNPSVEFQKAIFAAPWLYSLS